MGRFKWQWVAVACMCVGIGATIYPSGAADSAETEAEKTKQENQSAAGLQIPAAPSDAAGDEDVASNDEDGMIVEELQPCNACSLLPLSPQSAAWGTTAPGSPAEEALSSGVTVTSTTQNATAEPATPPLLEPETTPDQATPSENSEWQFPSLTPDNGRFPMQDRVNSLSPTIQTEDPGPSIANANNKPAPQPQTKPAAAPQTTSPAVNASTALSETPDTSPDSQNLDSSTPLEAAPATAGETDDDQLTLGAYFAEHFVENGDSYVQEPETSAAPAESSVFDTGAPASTIGVISTSHSSSSPEQVKPTVGEVLSGKAQDDTLGSGLAGINPWRSLSIVTALLGLLFCAAWIARRFKSPLGALNDRSLSVIETINIGAGRQIIIVEMNEDALVLGVTPHSINLLDKVPLTALGENYQKTVNSIIERESTTQLVDWRQRPRFATATVAPAVAPALPLAGYGPTGRRRMNVGELRRSRAASSGRSTRHAEILQPAPLDQEQGAKRELIERIREQLRQLED